jgi:hypothetical protein
MENIIFLSNTSNPELSGKYFAIYAESLVSMPLSDTYSQFGQSVGADDCGDSLELLTQKAVDKANQIYYDRFDKNYVLGLLVHFKLNDVISACEERNIFENIIASDLIEDEDYNLYQIMCTGFNYWDGNNWKSIIVSDENGSCYSWEVLEDKELTQRLLTVFEEKEFVKSSFDKDEFETDEFKIVISNFSSSWDIFTIEEK